MGVFSSLFDFITNKPSDKQQIIDQLHDAEARAVIDGDTVAMMEGALVVSEMKVREAMLPRSQMVTLDITASPDEILPIVVESGHSRFPVMDEKQEKVVGILLAIEFGVRPLRRRGQDPVQGLVSGLRRTWHWCTRMVSGRSGQTD